MNRKIGKAKFSGWYQKQASREIKEFHGLSLSEVAMLIERKKSTVEKAFKKWNPEGYKSGLNKELSLTFGGRVASGERKITEAVTVELRE